MDRTTEMLASYATSLGSLDLTPAAMQQTASRMIDSLGCAMGGYRSEPSKIVRRLATMYTSPLPAGMVGPYEPFSGVVVRGVAHGATRRLPG